MTIESKIAKVRRKLQVSHNGELFARGKTITTGVVAFDEAMNGGLPEGKVVEIYGDFSSGKSLFVYQAIANLQQAGGVAVLIDTEDSLNGAWAKSVGMNLDTLVYISPLNTSEELTIEYAFKELENMVTLFKADPVLQTVPAIFSWDSVAATKSKEEGEEMIYKPEMAIRARVISQLMRKVPSLVAGSRVVTILVNQLRDNVGVMYGKKEDTPGGRAIKFHAHLRLGIKKGKLINKDKVCIGQQGSFRVEKSKVGKPFKTVDFEIDFDSGIPKYSGLKEFLIREKIVVMSAGWGKIGDYRFQNLNDETWGHIQEARRTNVDHAREDNTREASGSGQESPTEGGTS